MQQRNPRRTREDWQRIMEQFRASDLSGVAFCEAQAISYASFCWWKRRLSAQPVQKALPAGDAFVDLQSLVKTPGQWKIVLRLGAGIELELSQR